MAGGGCFSKMPPLSTLPAGLDVSIEIGKIAPNAKRTWEGHAHFRRTYVRQRVNRQGELVRHGGRCQGGGIRGHSVGFQVLAERRDRVSGLIGRLRGDRRSTSPCP